MQTKKVHGGHLLRLVKDEKIVETVTKFCEENSIHGGVISGLGGASDITLGFYDLTTKKYSWKEFAEIHEILSMNGNVALVDGKPFLHIHIALSNHNFQAIGGHLKEATVGATCEVMISDLATEMSRIYDDEIGLKLLDL